MNDLRKPGTDQNELPALLRGWFGPEADAPGTAHRVVFQPTDDGGYRLQPIGGRVRKSTLVKWRAYSREEIPPLFGLEFSEAHWNQGHISLGGHQFLVVSLEKNGQQEQFQYRDHFVSSTEFEWQSQNRATQGNSYGLRVRNHRERVRPSTCSCAGTGNSMAAPRRSSIAARWSSRTGTERGPSLSGGD